MNQAFPDLLDRIVLLGGALAFLALFAGCALLALCLLRPASSRPARPAPGDDEPSPPKSGWLVRTLAVFLGGLLLLFSCLWWIGRAVAQLARPDTVLQLTAADSDSWAVNLFPWD